MTPFFFLLPLCVSFAGGDNCDYSWTFISDREHFESLYTGNHESDRVGSFTDTYHKIVYLNSMADISHEVGHIMCELEYPLYPEGCHVKLDMADISQKSRNWD